MPVDIVYCDKGHKFCKECVRRGAEIEIGQGKLDFPCLQNCDAKFSLQILQVCLSYGQVLVIINDFFVYFRQF